MTVGDDPRFGAVEVIEIASRLAQDDSTFLVGGQATNLWAWLYKGKHHELSAESPITSRDIDYFGEADAADALAVALGGIAFRPKPDDMNTPNTAKVVATYNGKELVVDFLNGILGVRDRRELLGGVSTLEVGATIDGVEVRATINVLHPILCLKSRVGNMLHKATRRRDEFAWRQLHAAVAVVIVYIEEALLDGDTKEAQECLGDLFEYVRSDPFGRKCFDELGVDLIEVLCRFEENSRLDARYRSLTLAPMIERLRADRLRLSRE